jgi:hypothetical protein
MISFGGASTVTPDCTPGISPGDDVTCQVQFAHNFLVLQPLVTLISGTLGGTINESSTTIMRME